MTLTVVSAALTCNVPVPSKSDAVPAEDRAAEDALQ
jgi:hypothetical protein